MKRANQTVAGALGSAPGESFGADGREALCEGFG